MKKLNVLMIGTGEYTTGVVGAQGGKSDKHTGVIALALFDLRKRGLVDQLHMVGTNGTKFPSIREHMQRMIGDVYKGLDLRFQSYPADDIKSNPTAYIDALGNMAKGDVVTVFTPDDTHFSIAAEAVKRGCHVLIAKPLVKTVKEHQDLQRLAEEHNVLVAMEVHKRWDPIYADARDRIRGLGDFSYYHSYMSQPKSQLGTFVSWAGKSSDISYYLNSHHIDFHCWSVKEFATPISVTAMSSTGVAQAQGLDTEDSITLIVKWKNTATGNLGTALYTSSWIAPKSDVHSQQRFFYAGHTGEINVDQAHRGYSIANDATGFASPNPIYMKYTPSADGEFAGQSGYGYRSIDAFVKSASDINSGTATIGDARSELATIQDTQWVTEILEAGRISLDNGGTTQMLNLEP